jgi:hypothetical protein
MKALSIVKAKSEVGLSPEEEKKRLEDLAQELKEKKEKGKMIKDENDEKVVINFGTYKHYYRDYFGGCSLIIVINFAMIM